MATLAQRLTALATAIGADVKLLTSKQGDLSTLPTTAKTSLVAALIELHGLVGSGGGAGISDGATSGGAVTYSVDKILALIDAAKAAVKTDLTNGATAALDTLQELAAALGNDPNYAATVAAALGVRLRFDAAQNLTAAQQLQACTNLGLGDPTADLLAVYTTAKA